jgi:hypothetical protein
VLARRTCQTHLAHQPLDGAAGNRKALAHDLPPNLAHAINREVLGKHTSDLGLEGPIPLRPRRQAH